MNVDFRDKKSENFEFDKIICGNRFRENNSRSYKEKKYLYYKNTFPKKHQGNI